MTTDLGSLVGEIETVGRYEVILKVANDQRVTISGISDTLMKRFAANLFKTVEISMEVVDG